MPNVFQNLVSSKRVYREIKMLCFFKHENVSILLLFFCFQLQHKILGFYNYEFSSLNIYELCKHIVYTTLKPWICKFELLGCFKTLKMVCYGKTLPFMPSKNPNQILNDIQISRALSIIVKYDVPSNFDFAVHDFGVVLTIYVNYYSFVTNSVLVKFITYPIFIKGLSCKFLVH